MSKHFEIVEYLRKDAKGKVMDKRHALTADPGSSLRRARGRDPDRGFYASAVYEHESGRDRSWFGGGWGTLNTLGGTSGPLGGGPSTSGPSTSGQGGGFWRR